MFYNDETEYLGDCMAAIPLADPNGSSMAENNIVNQSIEVILTHQGTAAAAAAVALVLASLGGILACRKSSKNKRDAELVKDKQNDLLSSTDRIREPDEIERNRSIYKEKLPCAKMRQHPGDYSDDDSCASVNPQDQVISEMI